MSDNITICNLMQQFSTSPELRFAILVNYVILFPAIPIISYSLQYVLNQRLFHRNTRLQIVIHLIALLIHCSGRFVLHSLDLYNYLTPHENGCQILPNFYRCLIFRGLYNIGQAVVSMTPISITVERYLAVKYNNAYEKCPFRYGIAIGALQIFLAFCYLFTRYVHAPWKPSTFTFFYCQTLASSTITTAEIIIPLYLVVFSQITSRIMFGYMEARNKRLRAVSDITLSTRFTLTQGIRSISALKTFLNFNCLMISGITLGMSILHIFSDHFTKIRYMAITELNHEIPLYGLCACLAVYYNLKKTERIQRIAMQLNSEKRATSEMYFQMFDKQIKS